MSQPKILVAQLGARRHYQQPLLFQEWGILDKFYTDFYADNNRITNVLRKPIIYTQLPSLFKKGLDRYDPLLDKKKIVHFPSFGYQFIKLRRKSPIQDRASLLIWAGKEFGKRIIKHGLGNANTVYGFNGESLELFEYALSQGIRCILDQTIAERSFLNKLLLEEEKVWQDWSKSHFIVHDTDLKLLEREQKEQKLANHIICGSHFVKDSLIDRGINASKISIVALGRQKESQFQAYSSERKTPQQRGDGLKILFAGTVNLRKGIPYLLEALRKLKGEIPFICKIAGSIEIKSQRVAEYSSLCDFLGRVPRSQMAELYAWADVFVLPSICEGSAMVTYEALSWALPVITTPNSGSIVRNGINGFIVPIRDSEAITEKLINIYEYKNYQNYSRDYQTYLSEIFDNNINTLMEVICNRV
ncbi:MAG: glycosyltransferase family 4 protein [Richelia sp. SL_2_1]|nr:glycosyltransferase family 4 protein [Richelia sp. SM1_7_0]NJN08024.1 glycosyltransferase family 4 protein [Richelia sp. RM1_1_1]NJO27816.1 glycosyltransferase family 4 protein [Richelia sp. SL_2_1]